MALAILTDTPEEKAEICLWMYVLKIWDFQRLICHGHRFISNSKNFIAEYEGIMCRRIGYKIGQFGAILSLLDGQELVAIGH